MDRQKIVSSREIGKRIKYRRLELSLTQEMLATMLDVSYQQVQRYESGKDRLNVEKLQVAAKALAVPIWYFFHHSGDEEVSFADEQEKELICHFRQARREVKELMINFAVMLAHWDKDWQGT